MRTTPSRPGNWPQLHGDMLVRWMTPPLHPAPRHLQVALRKLPVLSKMTSS
jgi:hypothetical protein